MFVLELQNVIVKKPPVALSKVIANLLNFERTNS